MADVFEDNKVAQIILGEAANQGPEGMIMVADTMFNRTMQSNKTMREIATQPKQFTAAGRPNLQEFFDRQPLALQRLAQELVKERGDRKFTPSHDALNYTTIELFNKRDTLPEKHWLRNMRSIGEVRDHVLLEDAR